ncbi:MAG: DUF4442 domain-containing protein [Gammaproteobacteria bacterium]|nr:DUF4442 domain-containing protein [Gammaproteobacteria bacterium]
MALFDKTATELIRLAWDRLRPLPGGIWIFNQFLRWYNPYTGSIRASVKELSPGYALIELADRRRVRNHLNSIHALALANLGEFTSGLALLGGLSAHTRGIPTKITTEYFKKARGRLVAESRSDLSQVSENTDFEVFTDIRDQEGDVVARTVVNWRLGPIESSS